ncbi:unnamed protein product [Rotaria sp. Silwood2]|nr:unnamed protein product [Rotaria sp. Silwood2]CAF3047798.1 unnamed protein product [Rotaria sp. Silwood2]CAF3285898.1 unnamed protein product [Rotaria sp. Silwood2]CAF3553366.1 unnamed protein product [Rotaria sp. Silwood2]CAF4124616.1 unnamed protein product [Rotaria sp. Silwood2]
MDNDSFLATLDEFIEITNQIIEKLKTELDWINSHRTRCNVAKTVGTAASVGGGAVVVGSLILAPFTGGASIVAATGYGFLASTAGAAVNLTTDITDMITTHIKNNQIESICGRRNDVAGRLKKHFDELERVAIELKRLNVEETEAYALSLKNLVLNGNSIRTSAASILKLSRCAQMASGTSNMLLRGGGTFWKGMRLQSETLLKVLGYFGFNVGKTGAMAVVRSGTAILSGVFAIYDVYSLINGITNNHPTAEAIAEMIKQMDEELNQIIELRRIAIEIGNGEYDK